MDEKSILKSKKFSVLSTLISIINENEIGDSNYILASYILDNFSRLKDLNIYDTAENCYVSRSSVRRFCKYIGLESFAELKKCSDEWEHQASKYKKVIENYSQPNYLIDSIQTCIEIIDKKFTSKQLEYLINLIDKSNNVLFVASEFSGGCLYEFQQAMFILGKPIKLMTSSYLNEVIFDSLKENDLVFVISTTGIYASSILEMIASSKCYKLLLTSVKNKEFTKEFDEIINLNVNFSVTEAREFSKYGVGYLLDKLLLYYGKKLKNDY